MTEEIKEDFLEVDSKIPGQNYVCLSFVSPEKILKNKEVYFVTKFLEYLMNDQERITQDIRAKMANNEFVMDYENVNKLYGDWRYLKNEDLEAEFYEMNDYRTTMRALKVRGVYDTYKEAGIRANVLRRKDPSFNVFVGQVGYWLPWDPECESVPEQEYQEGQLNELVKKYKENLDNRDNLYDQMKNERIEKAKKEVAARKEALKAQSEMNVPGDTSAEDAKNIEALRTIVDESDKLYYDNLKENGGVSNVAIPASMAEALPEPAPETSSLSLNSSEVASAEALPDLPQNVNNFKAESMSALEETDPWMARKNENN